MAEKSPQRGDRAREAIAREPPALRHANDSPTLVDCGGFVRGLAASDEARSRPWVQASPGANLLAGNAGKIL